MGLQKAKRVAEDQAEYPYTLFLSPRTLIIRLPLLASPYVSLCSVFDYGTSYVEAKAREGCHEAAYEGRDACKSAKYNAKEPAAKGSEQTYEACETTKGKAREATEGSERPPRHGRLPRTRPVRPLTRDPRRLLRRRRLPRTRPYRHFGVCQGGARQTS